MRLKTGWSIDFDIDKMVTQLMHAIDALATKIFASCYEESISEKSTDGPSPCNFSWDIFLTHTTTSSIDRQEKWQRRVKCAKVRICMHGVEWEKKGGRDDGFYEEIRTQMTTNLHNYGKHSKYLAYILSAHLFSFFPIRYSRFCESLAIWSQCYGRVT